MWKITRIGIQVCLTSILILKMCFQSLHSIKMICLQSGFSHLVPEINVQASSQIKVMQLDKDTYVVLLVHLESSGKTSGTVKVWSGSWRRCEEEPQLIPRRCATWKRYRPLMLWVSWVYLLLDNNLSFSDCYTLVWRMLSKCNKSHYMYF